MDTKISLEAGQIAFHQDWYTYHKLDRFENNRLYHRCFGIESFGKLAGMQEGKIKCYGCDAIAPEIVVDLALLAGTNLST